MVNSQLILEASFLSCRDKPITERGNVWVDQALFICAPTGGESWVARVIENGNAECFVSERTFDVAPGGPLLFAGAIAQAVGIQVGLARIPFVPGHADGKAANEEFAE